MRDFTDCLSVVKYGLSLIAETLNMAKDFQF